MGLSEGFETLIRTVLAAMIFFATAYRVVTALFEREIGGFGGLVLLGGLFALVTAAITNLNSSWYFLYLLAMFVWLAVAFVLPAIVMERERTKMLREDLEKALQGVAFDPLNVAAYCVLADTYRKMGNLDLAIENYQKALELQPTLKREKQRLAAALDEKAALQPRKKKTQAKQ
jgi:tetratricopeptide (TPR) repeat protein